mmetsp:Transcript_14083/g.32960  ORF Transcript_14083/g.32960 Transcript_14083/m.32960 type:complete len:288 (+) Transcript_14083:318-1181(+)
MPQSPPRPPSKSKSKSKSDVDSATTARERDASSSTPILQTPLRNPQRRRYATATTATKASQQGHEAGREGAENSKDKCTCAAPIAPNGKKTTNMTKKPQNDTMPTSTPARTYNRTAKVKKKCRWGNGCRNKRCMFLHPYQVANTNEGDGVQYKDSKGEQSCMTSEASVENKSRILPPLRHFDVLSSDLRICEETRDERECKQTSSGSQFPMAYGPIADDQSSMRLEIGPGARGEDARDARVDALKLEIHALRQQLFRSDAEVARVRQENKRLRQQLQGVRESRSHCL